MLLCAGRGERLRPLTDTTPKPLLAVGGASPLARHARAFAAAGFAPLVANLWHLRGQVCAALQEEAARAGGAPVLFSEEPRLLGAAGGIRLAMERGFLPEAFALANGDVVCDYDFSRLA